MVVLALLGTSLAEAHRFRATAPSKDAQEVQTLIAHFEAVNAGISKMLNNNASHIEKLRPSLQAFSTELSHTLDECKTDKKLTDQQKIEKLHNAQKAVEDLTAGLSAQQSALKKEGDQEKESLLMGVLMTNQGKPMKEQLEILEADDFKNLPVSKALVQNHDEKTPLFKQVAAYLDNQSKTASKKSDAPKSQAEMKALAKAQLDKVESLLQSNLERMEKNLATEEAMHKKHVGALEAALKKRLSNATVAKDHTKADHLKKVFASMIKKEDRTYQRWHALALRDEKSLKASLVAIKKGDIKAIQTARTALQDSLQAMQAQMGNFLHFLQVSTHTLRSKDCPYCAAQCLEKCHAAGKSYVTCMSVDCVDAGKR